MKTTHPTPTREMPELRECPFCGGKATIEKIGTSRASMIIACGGCGCRVESGDVVGMTEPKNYSWNTRADRLAALEAVANEAIELIVDELKYGGMMNEKQLREIVKKHTAWKESR